MTIAMSPEFTLSDGDREGGQEKRAKVETQPQNEPFMIWEHLEKGDSFF